MADVDLEKLEEDELPPLFGLWQLIPIKKTLNKHSLNLMKIMINNWSFKKFVISFLDKLDQFQELSP